jgi:hypothetical protein
MYHRDINIPLVLDINPGLAVEFVHSVWESVRRGALSRRPIATLPNATMSFTSLVSSLFPTVYADAPVEEEKTEETPEVSEEPAEEKAEETAEEEEEPEDVSIPLPPILF